MVLAQPLAAQHAALDDVEIRASGQAYLEATRLRGIDKNVAYYDPSRPAPPLETRAALGAARDVDPDALSGRVTSEGVRVSSLLIASILLFGIIYIFVVFGGRIPVSFSRNPSDRKASDLKQAPAGHGAARPMAIETILQMSDRRTALVALCKTLLARAVSAQGVLLQDSWTDRDALRSVPRSFAQHAELRALVYASERVQFGGRDVTEDEFRHHVAALRPMLAAERA